MDNSFKNSLMLKLDKKSGLAHLSVRTSDYKVEVFKINISEMGSVLMQYSDAMRDQDGPDVVVIEPENSIKDDENNLDNNQD
jgi:hypothetical protein